jgi:hypothetical protein
MANCEQCGYSLECHAGCGIFCRNDCTDCILWCEPHDHVMLMRTDRQGDGAKTRVSIAEGLDRLAGTMRPDSIPPGKGVTIGNGRVLRA